METSKFKDNLVWRTDQRLIGQKQLLEEHTKGIAQIEKTIVQYSADPTVNNLEILQKSLEMLSNFEIGSLISC